MTTRIVHEVRFYNGILPGFDTQVIYQCNFVTENGIAHAEITGGQQANGTMNVWGERNPDWFIKWFPQIVADVKHDPINGWTL